MSEPSLRQLTANDLDDALVLSSTAGWNQRVDDWRMLLALAPHGCFATWSGDRVVGTAIGIDYGGFGWIAMMLVDPAWRGRGLGRRLLEAAVAAIAPDRVIRLDATPLGRPLYQSYGFQDEARLTRLVAPAGAREAAETAGEADAVSVARPLTTADMPAVADVDRDVFGGHRRPVLEWALDGAPASGWMVPGKGAVPQYCLGRRGRLFDQIGPVIAYDDRAARALVSAARRAASDRSLVIDAAEAHPAFAGWLRTRGFADERPLFRMRLERTPAAPPASRSGSVPTEFAILGPEFG
jgi:GNAT superfamily N-acetyltransferase